MGGGGGEAMWGGGDGGGSTSGDSGDDLIRGMAAEGLERAGGDTVHVTNLTPTRGECQPKRIQFSMTAGMGQ